MVKKVTFWIAESDTLYNATQVSKPQHFLEHNPKTHQKH